MAINIQAIERYKIQPDSVKDGNYMGIKVLDSCIVDINRVDGEKFFGISGLEYDEKSDILYMLSDRGRLFTFKISLKDTKINSLKPLHGYRVKDRFGRKFLKPHSDSEGLALVGDELLISFERYVRILRTNLKANGYKKKSIKLPKRLKNIKNFQGINGALEALTYHPKYGILTTGEFPLKGQDDGYQGIYNLTGEICKFKKDYFDNAVTGFETMNDGNLLILQRDFNKREFKTQITLKKLYLDEIKNGICKTKNLAVMKSDDDWKLDNFEGIAHYKNNIYFMISDDNNFFLQKTILTMFEVVESK